MRRGPAQEEALAPGPLRWLTKYLSETPERAQEMRVDLAVRMAQSRQHPRQGIIATTGPMRHQRPAANLQRHHVASGPIAGRKLQRPKPRRQSHAPSPPMMAEGAALAGLPFTRCMSSSEGLPLTRCISLLDDNDLAGIASHTDLLDRPTEICATAEPALPQPQLEKSSSTHSPLAQPQP